MKQRIIKFRAWDKKQKKMLNFFDFNNIYGYEGEVCGVIHPNGHNVITYNDIDGSKKGVNKDLIIMQYTGLKDKNGKEIYEADIIQYKGDDNIVYKQECPSLYHYHFYSETGDNKTTELIGNIYQNKDLLK